MKAWFKYYAYFIFISCTLIICALYIQSKHNQFNHVIRADGAGYYVWLPAVLNYQDNHFKFCDTIFSKMDKYAIGYFNTIVVDVDSNVKMNKYSVGCAISALPFYLVANIYGHAIKKSAGYERHYQIAWLLASLFYACLGLYFLFALAQLLQKPPWLPLLLGSILVFGTNLFQYITFDASYSHAFTFGWVSILVYYLHQFKNSLKFNYLNLAMICGGMIVLIRPFNLLLLPIIFLIVQTPSKWFNIFKYRSLLSLKSVVFFLGIISVQLMANYWQTGRIFIYSYGNESFDFTHSHLREFLFGFDIGAFVYSPLFLVLIIISTAFLIQSKQPKLATFMIAYFIIIAWILSCWEAWRYGCTLGNRPLVDWYVVFVIPILHFSLTNLRKHLLGIVCLVLITTLGISYNQILHYQYRNFILNWCSMDYQKYKDVFLKTDLGYAYYTTDGWDFSMATNDKIEQTFKGLDTIHSVNNYPYNYTLLKLDSIIANTKKRYRLKLSCKAKFNGHRADNKLVVYVNRGSDYHGFQKVFIKQRITKSDEWMDYELAFEIQSSTQPLNAIFILEENNASSLELKNVKCDLISFDALY